MSKVLRLFFSVFLLLASTIALQLSAVAADDTADQLSSVFLPDPLTPEFSSDGNTVFNGIPLKAVINDSEPSLLRHIPAPAALLAEPGAATASFSITYVANGGSDPWGETCFTFPAGAKAAFNAAANIWANTLKSSVPITISACWANLGSSSILGYSGGGPLRANFTGATRTNTWYGGSLANALHGSDLDSGKFDMHITYNLNFSWYYGTDGNTPATQHDLMTVVLHEIAHGLNFSGSMRYASGVGSWGYGTSYPNIYDVFVRDGSGKQLITYTNGSTALGSALVSNNLWFYGSQAMAANGSQRVRMYAPSTWSGGSSYSHLDYNTFNNTSNQLMVYAISAGESIHDPGVVTKGLLTDLGWTTSSAPPPPPPPATSSSWPLYTAAIQASMSELGPTSTIWGVGSKVCCTTSSATFSITSSGITKNSTLANCSTPGTWEGWVSTTTGSKSFTWKLVSAGCKFYSGSFNYNLNAGKSYYFQLELVGSKLVIYVYINSTSSVRAGKETDQTADDITGSMQLENIIQLDIPKGAYSESSGKVAD